MIENKAPVAFELLLADWAEWKMSGCSGRLGFPRAAAFTRLSGGGLPDYIPDVDRAIACADVDAAVVAVGGIHQGLIEVVYMWPGMIGIRKAMEKYKVSQRTIYNWLDTARFVVWQEYVKIQA